MMKLTDEILLELRAKNLPVVTAHDILDITGDPKEMEEQVKIFDEYLKQFTIKKDDKGRTICVCCGALQGGDVAASFLGIAKFEWGFVHGEGFCASCGYPARAYHYDLGMIKKLNAILQYHPSVLSLATGGRSASNSSD